MCDLYVPADCNPYPSKTPIGCKTPLIPPVTWFLLLVQARKLDNDRAFRYDWPRARSLRKGRVPLDPPDPIAARERQFKP